MPTPAENAMVARMVSRSKAGSTPTRAQMPKLPRYPSASPIRKIPFGPAGNGFFPFGLLGGRKKQGLCIDLCCSFHKQQIGRYGKLQNINGNALDSAAVRSCKKGPPSGGPKF